MKNTQQELTVRDAVTALDKPEQQRPRSAEDLLAMAIEKGADVSTLERLMVVRKEILAEQAKTAYFEALAAFQSECPVILKQRPVQIPGGANYRYAPLDQIVQKVRPLMERYGFSHQEDSEITEGWVTAIVTITHRAGHSETKRFKVPSDTKAGMSPQQKYGAAMTFATRYAFCAALGIRTADEDTDCQPGDGPEAIAALKAELWRILKPVRGAESNWKQARQWLVDECVIDPEAQISAMDAEALREVIKKTSKKL